MTLGFSTKINGHPTYFVEKIWTGLIRSELLTESDFLNVISSFTKYYDPFRDQTHKKAYVQKSLERLPKLHTIRADPKNRWKAGNKIHFVINNRTKDRFQFAPVMECKSVQEIEIKYIHEIQKYHTFTDVWGGGNRRINVYVDGVMIGSEKMEYIAQNDGFANIEAFFDWFKEDFKGKIIHWTELKY